MAARVDVDGELLCLQNKLRHRDGRGWKFVCAVAVVLDVSRRVSFGFVLGVLNSTFACGCFPRV